MTPFTPVRRALPAYLATVLVLGCDREPTSWETVQAPSFSIVQAATFSEFPIPTPGNPAGLTAGPDGALWFTEQEGNKVGRLTLAGTITEFPIPTAGSVPLAIAAGPDGALWFAEQAGNAIGRITTAGAITEFPVPAANVFPAGIAAGPDGAMWFTEQFGNQISRITTSGAITEFPIPTPASRPLGIASGPDGAMWFSEFDGNKIGRITTGGTITEFTIPTAGRGPTAIAAGPDGALWFTESAPLDGAAVPHGSTIGRVTTAGAFTEFPTPTASSGPFSITAGPDGALWFTEYPANQIGRITVTGSITEFPILTAASGPGSITAGPDGALWFNENGANQIARISPNVAPVVGAISTAVDPVQVNTIVAASASFTDANATDTHTGFFTWGDATSSPATITESNGSGTASGSHTYSAAGVYTVTLTVADNSQASGQSAFEFVVVFDPAAGFVTGGGWITSPAGAYNANPSLTGKATFGFVSRYQKGATVPSGTTQFQFQEANFAFHSTSYDWLVISGPKAQYKGSGTINGFGDFGFLLTAIDGEVNGGGGVDKFRFKVWDKASGNVIYDNQVGANDTADPSTVLGGGDIVIHK